MILNSDVWCYCWRLHCKYFCFNGKSCFVMISLIYFYWCAGINFQGTIIVQLILLRSSHQRYSIKRGVTKSFEKLTSVFQFFLLSFQLVYLYRISSNKRRASDKRRTCGYRHWNKCLPLISAAPLNVALIRMITTFYFNIAKPKCIYICWYLSFFIIFIDVKICVILILKEKMTKFGNLILIIL